VERDVIVRQRTLQTGAIECGIDQLVAQFFLRATRHELHRHLAQTRQVLLQVLDRLLQLQREQAPQARTVDARGFVR
jgi:hypothetical protein